WTQQWPGGIDEGAQIHGGDLAEDQLVAVGGQSTHHVEGTRGQETDTGGGVTGLAEDGFRVALVLGLGIDAGKGGSLRQAAEDVEADKTGRGGDGDRTGGSLAIGGGGQSGDQLAGHLIRHGETEFRGILTVGCQGGIDLRGGFDIVTKELEGITHAVQSRRRAESWGYYTLPLRCFYRATITIN